MGVFSSRNVSRTYRLCPKMAVMSGSLGPNLANFMESGHKKSNIWTDRPKFEESEQIREISIEKPQNMRPVHPDPEDPE